MNIYIVFYSYTIADKTEEDTWIIAKENEKELRDHMDLNARAFKAAGMSLDSYSFQKKRYTDNGHKLFVEDERSR